MAEPWQCPACKTWLAPHVTEHRCDPSGGVGAERPTPEPPAPSTSITTWPGGGTSTTTWPGLTTTNVTMTSGGEQLTVGALPKAA